MSNSDRIIKCVCERDGEQWWTLRAGGVEKETIVGFLRERSSSQQEQEWTREMCDLETN
jgi:hypothetical protein